MKKKQIAVQLYTLREHLKTPADIAQTLKRVRQIGYEAVQVSGMGPIAEEELTEILDDNGLMCVATHENGVSIIEQPGKIVERLSKLKCKYTAFPSPGKIDISTTKAVLELAKKLNAAGKVLHEAGMTLLYHNHSIEFIRVDGKLILDLIYDNTDPRYLQGEPDTYWLQHGGGDPVAWCKKLAGRLPIIHLKDYKIVEPRTPDYAEIGNGNLNWKEIIPEAEKAGCKWFCVEQDTCPGDPFDSLKISFDYIAKNFCD